jgi:hypothetical protein
MKLQPARILFYDISRPKKQFQKDFIEMEP